MDYRYKAADLEMLISLPNNRLLAECIKPDFILCIEAKCSYWLSVNWMAASAQLCHNADYKSGQIPLISTIIWVVHYAHMFTTAVYKTTFN